jgi:uncharacterized protein YjdB
MRKILVFLSMLLIVVFLCGTAASAANLRAYTQPGYDVTIEYYANTEDMFFTYLHDKDYNIIAVGLDNEGCFVYGEWDLETGGVKQVLDENGEEYVVGVRPAPASSKLFPIPDIAYKAREERVAAYESENPPLEFEPDPDGITYGEYMSQFRTASVFSAASSRDMWDDDYSLHPVLPVVTDQFTGPNSRTQKVMIIYVTFDGDPVLFSDETKKEAILGLHPSYFNDMMYHNEEWRPYIDPRGANNPASADKFSKTWRDWADANNVAYAKENHPMFDNGIYHGSVAHHLNYGSKKRFAIEPGLDNNGKGGIVPVVLSRDWARPYDTGNVGQTVGAPNTSWNNSAANNTMKAEVMKKVVQQVDLRQIPGATYNSGTRVWSIPASALSVGMILTGYSFELSAERCVLNQLPGVWGNSAGSVSVPAADCPAWYDGASVSIGGMYQMCSHALDESRALDGKNTGENTPHGSLITYSGIWPARPRQFVVYAHELSHNCLSITDTYDTSGQTRNQSAATLWPIYFVGDMIGAGDRIVIASRDANFDRNDSTNWFPGTRYAAAFGNWGTQGVGGYIGALSEDVAARGGNHDPWNWVDRSRLVLPRVLNKSEKNVRLDYGDVIRIEIAPLPANGIFSTGTGTITSINNQTFYLAVRENRGYDQGVFDWARKNLVALRNDATYEGNLAGAASFAGRNGTGGVAGQSAFRDATGGLLIAHVDMLYGQSSGTGNNPSATYGFPVATIEAYAYPSGIYTMGDQLAKKYGSGALAGAYPDINRVNVPVAKVSYPETQHLLERYMVDRARGEYRSDDVRFNMADPADLFNQWGVNEFVNPRLFSGDSRVAFTGGTSGIMTKSADIIKAMDRQRHPTGPVAPFAIRNIVYTHGNGLGESFVTFDFEITANPGITLNSSDIEVLVGATRTLTATITPETYPGERAITWTSGNTSIATVNASGVVTGVKEGTTTVRAALTADPNVSKDCTVVVTYIPVTGITLDKAAATILLGSNLQLTATVSPSNATYRSYTWSSDSPYVASVDQTGLVRSIAPGSANIKVTTIDGFTATCYVFVATPASRITISPAAVSIDAGTSLLLLATVEPFNVSDANVVWSSSNPEIVTVNQGGQITAVGSGRTVTITARAADGSGVTGTCTVYVPPVLTTGVKLNKNTLALLNGQSERLIATVLPTTAANKNVKWTSNSPYVLTVDNTGLITTIGAGSGIVTVETEDGGFTDTCYVLVTVPVTGITITPSAVSVDVGQVYWLTATVEPYNAGNANLSWSSSNTAVATVNQAGFVTAVAAGTTTIKATALDGSEVFGTCTVNVPDPIIRVTGVSMRSSATINALGGTMQLTPTISPSNATDKLVAFSSSNANVASVNPTTGLVTGLSVGSAIITVRTNDGGYTATCTVFVYVGSTVNPSNDIIPEQPTLPPGTPTGIGIVSAEPIIFVPASTDLSLEKDMLSTMMPGFSSGDFRVNEYGIITLQDWLAREIAERLLNINLAEVVMLPVFEAVLNKPGEIGAVSFIVKGKHLMVDGLISKPENVRLLIAQSSTSGDWFSYASTGAELNDKKFTVLDMNNGIYTGELDANTSYKILFLIKDGGAFDLDRQEDAAIWGAMAFVGVPVMRVTLSPNHVSLLTGQSFDFSPGVTYEPAIADNKKVTWRNSNSFIASITAGGFYTTVGAGYDTIRVTTIDDRHWDESTVYVSIPVSTITITPLTTTISVGGVVYLTENVLPYYAENANVTWKSSDDTVATVNQSGVVRGVKAGTVTITATAADGSGVFGTATVTVIP